MAYIPREGYDQQFDLESYIPNPGNMSDFYLVVGEIPVYEAIGIAESAEMALEGIGAIEPVDSVLAMEYAAIQFDLNEINIYDDIAAAEVATLEVTTVAPWTVSVYEDVTTEEAASIDALIDITITQNITAAEEVTIYLDVLNVNVYELEYIVINESVSMIDLVVEVGIVAEYNYIAEAVEAALDVLNIAAQDDAAIAEDIAIMLASYNLDAYDQVAITESVDYLIPENNVSAYDEVTIQEDAQAGYDDYSITVADAVATSEEIESYGMTIAVSQADEIAAAEYVELLIPELMVEVYDATATEDAGYAIVGTVPSQEASGSDDLAITEDVTAEVLISIDAYDTSEIAEYIEMYPDALHLDVASPDIVINESVSVIDLVVEIGYCADLITIAEATEASIDVLNIDASDDVAATEEPALSIDALYFDVYDEAMVEEATEQNLTSLLIITYQDVTAEEAIEQYITELFIKALDNAAVQEEVEIFDLVVELESSEDIVVAEDIAAYLDALNIDAYDDVAAAESAEVTMGATPAISIDVYDEASIAENLAAYLEISIAVDDQASIAENTEQYLDVLNVDVYELEYIVINEHVSILDIIVEVGIAVEYNYIAEEVTAALDNVFIDQAEDVTISEVIDVSVAEMNLLIYDEAAVTEDIQAALDVLNIAIDDATTIAEYAEVLDITIEMSAWEDIAATEDAAIGMDALYISVEEAAIGTTEYVNMLDIIIEIGLVFDEIAIAEWAEVLDLTIELWDAIDLIFIEENLAIVKDMSSVEYEDLTITETVDMNMPINFEAAEQGRGIKLIQVSGW